MKTETKVTHTPGPWVTEAVRDRDGIVVWLVSGHRWNELAVVNGNEDPEMNSQGEVNARLIAAAPDLLAFVRGVGSVCEWGCQSSEPPCERCQAKALVARIDGEQS